MGTDNPEIANSVDTGALRTNYHDQGSGDPLLLLHGSGPGVSAYANWRAVLPSLAEHSRVIAPDLAGFGYTEIPEGHPLDRQVWLTQLVDLLDALGLEKVDVVGNSFGGSMALALAIHHPHRVRRLILMGSVGVPFELTEGLDAVWGYQPSEQTMGELMRHTFAYDSTLISDDLVTSRYRASLRTQADFERMFPAPRQRWVDAMAHSEEEIRSISCPALMVHGRDDKVIPLQTTLTLLEWIDDSRAHLFGRCGHWTQVEYAAEFCQVVRQFLDATR